MIDSARLDRYIYWTIALYCLMFAVSVPWAYFAIDVGLILLFARVLLSRHDIQFDCNLLLLAGCFIVICLISAWNGYNPKISLEKTWQVSYTMVAPYILASFVTKTQEQRKTLILLVSISLAATCVYEVYQGLIGHGSEGGFLGRMQLAGQIVQAFPLLIFGAVSVTWGKKHAKWWLVFLSFFATCALLFTGVRGAWVAMGAVVLLTLLTTPIRWRHRAIILIGLVSLAITIFLVQPKLETSFVAGVTFRAQSVTERFLMWRSASNIFLDHPVLGIGLGNFGDLYEQKYILPEAKEGRHPHPHNIFLQTLAETGIFGLIAFLALYGYALFMLIRKARRPNSDFWQQAAPIAVVGFLIYGMTDNLIYHFPAGFQFCWFLIGASWRNSS